MGGAALGTVFTELWQVVSEAKDRLKDFKPKLRDLENTLQDLVPMIEDIERLNRDLNESDQREVERLKSIMEESSDLISKCLRLRRWQIIKKSYYHKKLIELDSKIIRFNNKHIELGTFREVKILRLEVNQLSDHIQSVIRSCTLTSSTPSFSSSGANEQHEAGRGNLNQPIYRIAATGVLICLAFLSSRAETRTIIVIVIVIVIIIYKAIRSMLESFDESGVWMVINDVGTLKTTIEQLEDTMKSLDPVLEEIESRRKHVVMMNEADRSEAAECGRIRRLMREGEKLVRVSSNIVWWNFVKIWVYQKKMVELDNKLLKFLSLYLLTYLANNHDNGDARETRENDDASFKHAHYDEDSHAMKGRHTNTRDHESYGMPNYIEPYQYLGYNPPTPSSSSMGVFQQYELGR